MATKKINKNSSIADEFKLAGQLIDFKFVVLSFTGGFYINSSPNREII